jgi:hypothetical protein
MEDGADIEIANQFAAVVVTGPEPNQDPEPEDDPEDEDL